MPRVLIRATDADVPAVVELINVAFRGAGSVVSWNREDFIEGDRTNERLLRAELAEKPAATLLVWREEGTGTICGSVMLEPTGDDAWYWGSLTVDPRLQNAGLGRRLLAAAEQWAAARGAALMRLKVVNVRETLIAWYERRGYRLTGERESFPYEDGRFGTPRRDDLVFVVLEKTLRTRD